MWFDKTEDNNKEESTKELFSMKELVEMIAKSLVDNPHDVVVTEIAGESVLILEIRVNGDDVGKVIGKDGRIANAIRTVVKAAAAKKEKKVTVEILTDND